LAVPLQPLLSLLNRIGRRVQAGCLLLLTNRAIDRGKWVETHEIRLLAGLTVDEAVTLLNEHLTRIERPNAVPFVRREDIVRALGHNPRAIRVLVEALREYSLEDLIGEQPDLWDFEDREISAELLHKLESMLLERTLERLSQDTITVLERLSVYRKRVKAKVFGGNPAGLSNIREARQELINRFLVEHDNSWDSPNPVVREIILHRLKSRPKAEQGHHSLAADYYLRHFQARQLVGGGELGGHFVEARFHLVRADRKEELKKIVRHFERHLKATITSVSPVPKDPKELDERITLLSGLLEHHGAKGLEYHLARCLEARGQLGDLERLWSTCGAPLVQNPRLMHGCLEFGLKIDYMDHNKPSK
jgi:hypothetical protein